ncbi:tetratricopeptide repeat protein [Rubricoccus marinus]|uniref:Tetratricopeptide repeat protein n=1 Tax=Rubricoccus marinus TaxID=716817 RepID=A0A259U3B0_9BACT|nr:tetratricopeptide repeat protein [Rubricoccus marinus]OZC04318.1 tetratricopeptide repeat protein [Rubricoccus marinus]
MDRLAALTAFYEEDPDDPFTRFALAQEHLKAGDASTSLAFFEGLVRDHPAYVGTYYHLGALYAHLGREDDALRTYREGIAEATRANDLHARAELQSALLEAEGLGFE